MAGALLAGAIFALFPRVRILTTKLFHGPRYHSTMGSDLPTALPAGHASLHRAHRHQ